MLVNRRQTIEHDLTGLNDQEYAVLKRALSLMSTYKGITTDDRRAAEALLAEMDAADGIAMAFPEGLIHPSVMRGMSTPSEHKSGGILIGGRSAVGLSLVEPATIKGYNDDMAEEEPAAPEDGEQPGAEPEAHEGRMPKKPKKEKGYALGRDMNLPMHDFDPGDFVSGDTCAHILPSGLKCLQKRTHFTHPMRPSEV